MFMRYGSDSSRRGVLFSGGGRGAASCSTGILEAAPPGRAARVRVRLISSNFGTANGEQACVEAVHGLLNQVSPMKPTPLLPHLHRIAPRMNGVERRYRWSGFRRSMRPTDASPDPCSI